LRTLGWALLLASSVANAEPLWDAEARLGYGITTGAGDGTAVRMSPLTVGGQLAIAVNETPDLAAYGGLLLEALDRSSFGTTFGVRTHPREDSRLRLAGGGVWIIAPRSLWGASATVGTCTRGSLGYCIDAVATAFLAGDDLAMNHTVAQLQLVLSASFAGRP